MTTIAYRDGILACDSLYSRGGWAMGVCQKVWKTCDGRLIGVCGDFAHALRLVHWLRQPESKRTGDRPTLDKDTGTVVEVMPNGKARYYEFGHWHPQTNRYWAVGSGSIAALVAMDMGADATGAIKAAIRRDESSGGRVRSVRIGK